MFRSGQRLTCRVESLGYQGEGICKPDGFTVFVPFALPGELVHLELNKVHSSHAFAHLIEVLEPSPNRQAAPCGAFFRCGGCVAQHMPYEMQLSFKQQTVQANLDRLAKAGIETEVAIGLEKPWKYRNKTTWQLSENKGKTNYGFYGLGSHHLVPVVECEIAHPAFSVVVNAVAEWMDRNGIPAYNIKTGLGYIRQVVTRASGNDEIMINLISTSSELPNLKDLIQVLKRKVPGFNGLNILPGDAGRDEDTGNSVTTVYGKGFLEETLDGLRFQLSPRSFFQVNHKICEKMYTHALKEAGCDPGQTLMDVYSGIGTLSLLAAKQCKQVIGFELSPSSVQDARHNANLNRISNARFVQGYAERELPKLIQSGIQPDCLILDAPRSGVHAKVLEAAIAAGPNRLVHISCHPASQARDTKVLMNDGYRPIKSQPFDMFCQTAEIENVMTFVKENV